MLLRQSGDARESLYGFAFAQHNQKALERLADGWKTKVLNAMDLSGNCIMNRWSFLFSLLSGSDQGFASCLNAV